MTRCTTIDQSILEMTKVEKVLPRLVKRGDDQGKRFAQKVLDNAAEVSKQKTADETTAQSQDINGAIPSETKNARSTDAKKGDKSLATKMASASDARQSSKVDAKVGTKMPSADASSTKVKANPVTTKPSGFFSSLQSASKKPGTSSKMKDSKSR